MATPESVARDAAAFVQPEYSAAAKSALSRKPALFIDNEWVASTHDATLAVEDPSTGREIARIVDASDADVDRAVAAARAAFDDGRWTNLPPNQRERMMNRLADLVEAHADVALGPEVVDFVRPDVVEDRDHVARVGQVAVDQLDPRVELVRVDVNVLDPLGMKRGRSSDQAVDFVAAPQQPASEIRPVLSGNACNGGAFHDAVAQSCTLLYRRFEIGRAPDWPNRNAVPHARRMQFCDTAD